MTKRFLLWNFKCLHSFEEFTGNGLICPVNVNMFYYHLVFFQFNFLLVLYHSILY
jgi:hypothetical protein